VRDFAFISFPKQRKPHKKKKELPQFDLALFIDGMVHLNSFSLFFLLRKKKEKKQIPLLLIGLPTRELKKKNFFFFSAQQVLALELPQLSF